MVWCLVKQRDKFTFYLFNQCMSLQPKIWKIKDPYYKIIN